MWDCLGKCEDYSPDPNNCAKFIRCFYNLRIRFTCPSGTAWEDSLKTCVWREYVEACDERQQIKQRQLGKYFSKEFLSVHFIGLKIMKRLKSMMLIPMH